LRGTTLWKLLGDCQEIPVTNETDGYGLQLCRPLETFVPWESHSTPFHSSQPPVFRDQNRTASGFPERNCKLHDKNNRTNGYCIVKKRTLH